MEPVVKDAGKKCVAKEAPSFLVPQSMINIELEGHPDQKIATFAVHKERLCAYSKHFDQISNDPSTQVDFKACKVEDMSSRQFGVFVNWMYTKTLVPAVQTKAVADYETLCGLWIVGDRLQAPKFQNAVVDAKKMMKRGTKGLELALQLAFGAALSEGSQLTKLLVALSVSIDPNSLHTHLVPEQAWKEMFFESQRQLSKKTKFAAISINAAEYYIKDNDE